eukprot:CAMPEP_0173142146 /NCGR_PEP_ID=MMETSP1105-20130129/5918_1 /TAXON_ID=2985 /ORGANISM="Ochromonas sp., Strain BG-1" /LENGTH=1680 /DNA_ID=CAMNT_0014055489 /DNA_START=87 /DNA_END=5126 /DNA_ORIENTATION=-
MNENSLISRDTAVKVAVRIRPLSDYEEIQDSSLCINTIPEENQIRAGPDTYFTFDYVFGSETSQTEVYDSCVEELLHAAFEGFNATILAYGQTGSGKTYTMGSSSEQILTEDSLGIIPRVIRNLFEMINLREDTEPNCTYKVYVQFLEIYGEDIRDLLDLTRTSKVAIRETRNGEVFITGAREELVSSFEQMMKALEDGTKNRVTASTKMNQYSSRSHAIFTVNLERILYSDIENSEKAAADVLEVRKCKFHFVDLAGSERAKRTGAQGVQLKEGIDINKGLLALGNVISALGDESKKGKVFVPYRDSKLTRMLQDSLGGNSKTLMICCASPAAVNYSESLNALRYANRARNIKNKPVVNRDPNLVLLDELRSALKVLATELLQIRTTKQYAEIDNRITIPMLEGFANGVVKQGLFTPPESNPSKPTNEEKSDLPSRPHLTKSSSLSTVNQTNQHAKEIARLKEALKKSEASNSELKFKCMEADMELKRLIDQLKAAKLQCTEISEQMYFIQSERDYYQMKLQESAPETGQADLGNIEEKQQFVKIVTEHKREIEHLKEELAKANTLSIHQMPLLPDLVINPAEIDTDFTTTVSTLIAQTRQQLQEESRRLSHIQSFEKGKTDEDGFRLVSSLDSEEEVEIIQKEKDDEIEEERKFARRQRILSSEFQELGQSIQIKEQLMEQLIKSQQQYTIMKSYYEQKLAQLTSAVEEKQSERDKLYHELHDLELQKNETSIIKQRETKLRAELQLKDEELRNMKKKQEELKNLTQVQNQYSRQLSKLESDITLMKRQRIELSKTLQLEKKNHILALNEKVKEIEKLKKELLKASSEVKKLEKSKEMAENKMKDVVLMQREKENSLYALLTAANGGSNNNNKDERKKVPTRPLSMPDIATAASARAAIREINRNSYRFSSKRFLSEEELKTKKWIDQRITEISAREAAAEALKKQYEHQLELLHKKELLERERSLAILHAKTSDDGGEEKQGSSLNADKDHRSDLQNSHSQDFSDTNEIDSPHRQLLLSSHEEEKLLEIIEERISTINGQLNARNQKISDIEKQMNAGGEIAGSEKALEVLKRTAAGSLPASHELIRLLFDMLIHSNKSLQIKMKQTEDLSEKEKNLTMKIDDLQRQLISEKRNFDMELTSMNREYEEKLQSIFQQITTLEYNPNSLPSANVTNNPPSVQPPSTPDRKLFRPQSNNSILTSSATGMGGKFFGLFGGNRLIDKSSPIKSFDSVDVQLTIALEENKFLKAQNERESLRYAQLRDKCSELESIKLRLMRDLEEKNQQIRFLEEDRGLFKDMVEDLKMGLNKLGKDGKAVVHSVKHSANQQKRNGLFGEYLQISEDDTSDEEDSASVIGQFQNLAQEIRRGGLTTPTSSAASSPGFVTYPVGFGSTASTPTHSSSNTATAVTTAQSSRNIYDRLTNPSNYTGHMKNVFENDLELKRKKIQQMKNPVKGSNNSVASNNSGGGNNATTGIASSSNKKGNQESSIPTPSGHNTSSVKFFPKDDAGGGNLLSPNQLRSHSHDEYEGPVMVRNKRSSSSHTLLHSNNSNSASSHSIEVEINDKDHAHAPTTSSQRRRSISSKNLSQHHSQSSTATVKLNLDHLSLEDDSHSQNSSDNPNPESTNAPNTSFTRLTSRIPAPSNTSRSSSAARRKSLNPEDNSNTASAHNSRTASPAW